MKETCIMKIKRHMAACCVLFCLAASPAQATGEGEWRFRVFLDDREIGWHHFQLQEHGEVRRLTSEASFQVRLLFVKLYEYTHLNEETWRDNCLVSIDSQTDDNGKAFEVAGQRQDGGFLVRSNAGQDALPECVMSFAYWNPAFLEQSRLLNSQNGEYLDVEVAEAGPDALELDGRLIPARRFRLSAGELELSLWYSEQDDWLGLETEAKGGRVLRYVRIADNGAAS